MMNDSWCLVDAANIQTGSLHIFSEIQINDGSCWTVVWETGKRVSLNRIVTGKTKNFLVHMRGRYLNLNRTIRFLDDIKLFGEEINTQHFNYSNKASFSCLQIKFYVHKKDFTDDLTGHTENASSFPLDKPRSVDTSIKDKELFDGYELLSNDFSSFWKQNILSDLDIQCGLKTFKAHKAILAARSTYFAAMFQTPMRESNENSVVIQNTKPEVLQVVLSYIYSSKKPELSNAEIACEVFAAADLYNIPGLKRICSTFLRSSLSLSNVVHLLVFADLHDPDLKEAAIRFASDHFESLKDTEHWTNLQKQNPSLVISVMTEKIQKINSKGTID